LPRRARAAVLVVRLRGRAAVRRLPVRALRPHLALCRDRGTPATSVRESSWTVLAQSRQTQRPSARASWGYASPSSRIAAPAPAMLVSFISAYLRDSTTPAAPAGQAEPLVVQVEHLLRREIPEDRR